MNKTSFSSPPNQPVEPGLSSERHWLHNNMPDLHSELQQEVERLQHAIAALIAVGAVTEEKARKAYEIAGR